MPRVRHDDGGDMFRRLARVLAHLTAATSVAPRSRGGQGISIASPALTVAAVECEPNQSDIAVPSKPQSPRSTAVRSQGCSEV